MKLTAYIDGSCFGNPGESGYGVMLQDEQGGTLELLGRYIGKGTNNIAEYHGLLGAIELAAKYHAVFLKVFSDSELLVKQMNGEYRIKQPHLIDLHQKICQALEDKNIDLDIHHISRNENKVADGLARKAIRMQRDVT